MTRWRPAVEEYLQLRQDLGFKLHEARRTLQAFAAFLDQRRVAHLTIALALEWAQANPAVRPAEWARRLTFIRGFARHWSAQDPHTEVPPGGLLPYRPRRARPYLYTDAEVRRLLDAALQLPPAHGLRGPTYHALLGLLAVTGLRIGEALRLHPTDVDLAAGVLTIHGATFGKMRLVPIHPSTQRVLARYAARRDRALAGRPAVSFFVSDRGNRLDRSQVHRTFCAVSRQVGLRDATARHGPRLHDFRHRFAVQTLLRWYRAGDDVERRLPLLSTYLGHTHVAYTYWYLTACPELLGATVQRLEARWEGPR
ncbi:MAG TPA: tyrosine-type recombinase/integrase [Acidimicrobiales bacterium]|nr:tyrosine-type recombinase/integrase [Acidimicrobiales bacterium]